MKYTDIKRVVLAGYGSIGKRHYRNLRQLLPDAQMGIISGHLDHAPEGAMLLESLPVAVAWKPAFGVIASPASRHGEMSLPLLRAGVPLLIEKPLETSLETAAALEPYHVEPGILVGYCLRFTSVFETLTRIVEDGTIGAIQRAEVCCKSYLPDWRPDSDFRKSVSARPECGGGAIMEISHEIDYVCGLFGAPRSVQCEEVGARTLGLSVEESVKIALEYEQTKVVIELSFASKKVERYCILHGTTGQAKADFIGKQVEVNSKDGVKLIDCQQEPNQMYLNELESMIEFVQGSGDLPVTHTDGMLVLEIAEACKRSMLTEQMVLLA